jgi:HAD superfamily phosphoserine phosphatase-like hydrolase
VFLIVQSRVLAATDISGLVALCGATEYARLGATAARIRAHPSSPGVAEYCTARKLDFAWVPEERRLADVGLVAMDMDSTLITIECIDEIADMQGIKPQVAAITASAMRGEIDFAESLRRRVALLAGLEMTALQRVYDERLRLSPGAEAMLAAFRAVGATSLLVSGGFTFFTDRLRDKAGPRPHPFECTGSRRRTADRQGRGSHRRCGGQGRSGPAHARGPVDAGEAFGGNRRWRKRPADAGRSRHQRRVSGEACRAREDHAPDRLQRPRRRHQPVQQRGSDTVM